METFFSVQQFELLPDGHITFQIQLVAMFYAALAAAAKRQISHSLHQLDRKHTFYRSSRLERWNITDN